MAAATGYLIIADITGYTSFLAQAPTEAGGSITAGLLEELLDTVAPPFRVGNIEGDALFIYAEDDGRATGQTVLDAVDSLYCAFTDRVCTLRYGANCPNDPALLAGALDLKLIVHYGEYAINPVGGREELSGAAVICVHRLAKNTVTQDTGHSGYAMVTRLAVDEMGLDEFFSEMETRREDVEHIGAIDTYVYPLAPVWERRRRAAPQFVERSAPLLMDELTIDLAVPPCRAWELCTEPKYRSQWINGVKNITSDKLDHGRAGLGTVQYCDHGDGMVVPVEVADWHPFDYISYRIETPLGLRVDQTIELQPIGSGTRLAIRMGDPAVPGLLGRWRNRGKVEKLREIFGDLYADADSVLKRLARAEAAPSAA